MCPYGPLARVLSRLSRPVGRCQPVLICSALVRGSTHRQAVSGVAGAVAGNFGKVAVPTLHRRAQALGFAVNGGEDGDCLARHQVGHVYNSWTDMPTVSEQLDLAGSRTNPALVAARFLLTPGKTYERTIQDYEPFESIKKIDETARSAAATIIDEGVRTPSRYTYVFINNRLEGCAPRTIQARSSGRQCRWQQARQHRVVPGASLGGVRSAA
jgi:hypothetical protein